MLALLEARMSTVGSGQGVWLRPGNVVEHNTVLGVYCGAVQMIQDIPFGGVERGRVGAVGALIRTQCVGIQSHLWARVGAPGSGGV